MFDFFILLLSKGVLEQKVKILRRGEESSKQFVQSLTLQSLLLSEERISWEQRRGDIAQDPASWEWSQVIEEILQLMHLRHGKHSMKCNGVV